MKTTDIIRRRLYNHCLTDRGGKDPAGVVSSLCAVQAQDYLGGLWAIGLRLAQSQEGVIEQALAERKIVRTWPMRGTLHFIASDDIRWMLRLLTPRIIKKLASRHKELELDSAVFAHARKIIGKKLQGGKSITRPAAYKLFDDNGIYSEGQRGIHILMQLAQEGLLCFGKREGKQQTFVLLDEWIPKSRILTQEESLAELTVRYFTGHGPATIYDFVWWSGLTMTEAKKGVEMVKTRFASEVLDGKTYWFSDLTPLPKNSTAEAYLLPTYDEYLVGYKERDAVFDASHLGKLGARANILFHPTFILNGQVAGAWGRALKKDKTIVKLRSFINLSPAQNKKIYKAIERYSCYLNMQAEIKIV